jgi:hypothetical protein
MKLLDVIIMQKNVLVRRKRFTAMIWVVIHDVRIVLLSRSIRFVGESRRKGIEFTVLTYIFSKFIELFPLQIVLLYGYEVFPFWSHVDSG